MRLSCTFFTNQGALLCNETARNLGAKKKSLRLTLRCALKSRKYYTILFWHMLYTSNFFFLSKAWSILLIDCQRLNSQSDWVFEIWQRKRLKHSSKSTQMTRRSKDKTKPQHKQKEKKLAICWRYSKWVKGKKKVMACSESRSWAPGGDQAHQTPKL